ncbi:Transcriptional regulator of nonfermentable carbon utilization, partial [Podochytrium sp. JEL0797]
MSNKLSLQQQRADRTAMACLLCQQSHVTCSEERPCQRCAKRGVECVDGQRKKAKYLEILQDGSSSAPPLRMGGDLAALSSSNTTPPSASALHSPNIPSPNTATGLQHNGFGSANINSEYSFLSNMLDNNNNSNQTHLHLHQQINDPASSILPPIMHNHQQQQQQHQQQPLQQHNPDTSRADALTRRAKRVYSSVTRPFDYREGYHYLVKYIAERMEKQDIMRICGSLATFRPSFMAVMMHLSEEDLVFMEKCFQRTLIVSFVVFLGGGKESVPASEYEKLITYSGTPTVVWRRSGEISLVGKEFCLLTDWLHETLLPPTNAHQHTPTTPTTHHQPTYIYQLMDANSVIEYWERFATAAFDNTQGSWMVRCVLVSPVGRKIPCSVCFTIKRDIFDVPLAIIGNFLPLFQSRK